jgi:hypothetical protein
MRRSVDFFLWPKGSGKLLETYIVDCRRGGARKASSIRRYRIIRRMSLEVKEVIGRLLVDIKWLAFHAIVYSQGASPARPCPGHGTAKVPERTEYRAVWMAERVGVH